MCRLVLKTLKKVWLFFFFNNSLKVGCSVYYHHTIFIDSYWMIYLLSGSVSGMSSSLKRTFNLLARCHSGRSFVSGTLPHYYMRGPCKVRPDSKCSILWRLDVGIYRLQLKGKKSEPGLVSPASSFHVQNLQGFQREGKVDHLTGFTCQVHLENS